VAVKVQTKAETKPKEEPIIIDLAQEESPPEEFEGFEEESSFELLKPRELPPFPAKIIEVNKDHLFWEWQDKLMEDDWNHLTYYLFREWPIIDRQRINPKASINIEVIGSKFHKDSKKFLEEHGSGKYKLIVNDSNKAIKGKGGTIGTVRFQVDDPNYPPVFILEELVPEHPSNKSITAKLVAEGKLSLEGKVMNQNQGGNAATDPAMIALLSRLIDKVTTEKPTQSKDVTMDAVIQILTKTNDQSLQTLRDQIKGDSPDKTVQLIAAMKELMPKHESENSTLALIVKMQGDMAKVQADSQVARESLMLKMMEMMNSKKEGEDDFDKQIDRQLKLKELFGGNEGGGRKPTIPELIIEHGAPVLIKVMDTIQGFVNVRNYQAGLAKQQATNPNPQAATNPAMVEAPQQTNQPKQEGGNVVEMQTQEAQLQLVLKQAAPMILDALKRNVTGDEFADSVEKMFGTLEYQKIVAIGKEKIIGGLLGIPEFAAQVLPEVIGKFVDEFIDYGKEEGEEV
jgi:hypothetical protein